MTTLPAVFVDNAFNHSSVLLDTTLQNTSVYIAGWVGQKMFEHLQCETCLCHYFNWNADWVLRVLPFTETEGQWRVSCSISRSSQNSYSCWQSCSRAKAQLAMKKISSVPVASRMLVEIGEFKRMTSLFTCFNEWSSILKYVVWQDAYVDNETLLGLTEGMISEFYVGDFLCRVKLLKEIRALNQTMRYIV